MPFTVSHVAAVLPLRRARLAPSALVLGSTSPDFPYFLPLPATPHTTHAWAGPLGVDVLLGLAAYIAWHGWFAAPTHKALPAGVYWRLPEGALAGLRQRLSSVRSLFILYLSLGLGALTHVVWDSFTHPGKWGAEHVGWLREEHGPLWGTSWAQYASGVLGALVLALWLLNWFLRTPPSRTSPAAMNRRLALCAWTSIIVTACIAALWGMSIPLRVEGGPYLREAGVLAAIYSITGALLMGTLLSAAWHVHRLRPRCRS